MLLFWVVHTCVSVFLRFWFLLVHADELCMKSQLIAYELGLVGNQ